MASPIHVLQPSFASGLISPEVANRVDLDKYRAALTVAKNCYIRPYGPVYKRGGMVYCSDTKYADKECILVPFSVSTSEAYLLEIGDKYIRVLQNGVSIGTELTTPYAESDLPKLRFTQSADVMFITSGDYPVKKLTRTNSSWLFEDLTFDQVYFDSSLTSSVESDEEIKVTPSATSGSITLTADHPLFTDGMDYIQLTQNVPSVSSKKDATGSSSSASTVTSSEISANQYVTVTIKGSWNGNVKIQKKVPGWGTVSWSDVATYTSSQTVMLTSVDGTYRAVASLTQGVVGVSIEGVSVVDNTDDDGNIIGTDQETVITKASITATAEAAGTDVLTVGDTWKIITGGTWTGTVTVQYKVNDEWKELRTYQSKDNNNVTESGTFDEETDIRAVWNITSGTCTLTLSAMPYDKTGYAKLKPDTVSSDHKTVNADVINDFGTTSATKDYAWGVWCKEFGYPACACFFQDRLCFGATKKQPYAVWMSRTGDYYNFEVEKAGGNVTDDSAIAVSFISRKQQRIMHLVPSVDLLVLTEGNEWLVSGSEVVTPSNITPRLQATRGCNDCEPLTIGNRMIFIQGRGSTVRDMGYTYESDSYVGQDLTLLAQDLVRGKRIVDITYKQEPNSMVYCVRSDGSVICLSYIREQDVYAWSEVYTDGKIEAVCCVGEGEEDKVYASVLRKGKRYIEAFANDVYSDNVQDYIMLDSAVTAVKGSEKGKYTVAHLAGMTVDVLADGRVHKNVTVNAQGVLTIAADAAKITAGLPYCMEIELPNVEIQLGDGSMQGRKKTITRCMLRLRKSLGGQVGADFDRMDDIKYDELSATNNLQVFSGDKQATVPMGGYDYYGKLAIKSCDPYPFMLMCAVRVITFGG